MASKSKKRRFGGLKSRLTSAKRRVPNDKRILILAGGALIAFLVWLFWGIPLPNQLGQEPAVSTKIFDRNGKLIFEFFGEQKRDPIELGNIPQHAIDATIAIEDKDFFSHHGFSVSGMGRAAYKTLFEGKLEGGSTLTQQLVKNSLLSPERTIRRKAQEFILALIVEARFSKQEILEMYLNQIPYGSTAYGIEAASELYFNKNASQLSLGEAAMLAGLPAAPTRFSPFGADPSRARGRQEAVLRRMVEEGYIDNEEMKRALEEELVFATPQAPLAPHFALWVKELLAEEYGDNVVEQGGLRVTTTLDIDLHEFAQEAVADEVEKLSELNVGNGAVVVTRPKTGEILAMVGSKDYFAEDEDGKVNIIFAQRQPGSSIKPFNYALALQDGHITASTSLADVPTCFNIPGQAQYCPVNYDGGFHGAVQSRFALGNSYNIPAVRVLALNGLEKFVEFARQVGFSTFDDPSQYGLSLTLGGGEVRPIDMAQAYGALANGGIKVPLKSILKVEDWKGKVLFEQEDTREGDRVIDGGVSFIISQILLDNNARLAAFGGGSFLNVIGHPEVSVKTGTTNDRRDNWTAGYSGQAVVIAWVGNNDNSPMSGAVSGVSGASPIWNRIMKEVLDKAGDGFYDEDEQGQSWPVKTDNVVGASICANTGALPDDITGECPLRFEYYLEGTIPSGIALRQDLHVDRELQQIAQADTPPERIEVQNHLVIRDPLDSIICLTCSFPIQPVAVTITE